MSDVQEGSLRQVGLRGARVLQKMATLRHLRAELDDGNPGTGQVNVADDPIEMFAQAAESGTIDPRLQRQLEGLSDRELLDALEIHT